MRDDDWAEHDSVDDSSDDASTELSSRKLSFFEFWGMLCFAPARFFRHHFNKHESPYFALVLMIVGICGAIDRYERNLMKMDARGQIETLAWMNTWPALWTISIASGALGGYFFYYVGGWWYDVRVGFAGGRRDADTSRFILLYSSFIPGLVGVIDTLSESLSSPAPLTDAEFGPVGALALGLIIATSFYALYVSYRGVREVTGASRMGALTWFVVLPALVYMLAFGGMVALIVLGEPA